MRAREISFLHMAEEIVHIADDKRGDTVIRYDADGNEYEAADHEFAARSRLRVDTRKWILSKFLPKVFGDRVQHEGNVGFTFKIDLS